MDLWGHAGCSWDLQKQNFVSSSLNFIPQLHRGESRQMKELKHQWMGEWRISTLTHRVTTKPLSYDMTRVMAKSQQYWAVKTNRTISRVSPANCRVYNALTAAVLNPHCNWSEMIWQGTHELASDWSVTRNWSFSRCFLVYVRSQSAECKMIYLTPRLTDKYCERRFLSAMELAPFKQVRSKL